MKRLNPRRMRCTYHRFRLWLLNHLPAGFVAEPFAAFVAVLCLLTGLPTALDLEEPGPIQALLPHWLVHGWGIVLVVGGLGMLCGITSIRRVPGGFHAVTRVPCYRLGLRLLGISSLVYAYAMASQVGLEAPARVAVLLLFAATAYLRLLRLGGR